MDFKLLEEMSSDELSELLQSLKYAVMVSDNKGGASIADIKRSYKNLCGKDLDIGRTRFKRLEDLLNAHRELFRFQYGRWFGVPAEEDMHVVQSMATETSKGRRTGARGRFGPPPNRGYPAPPARPLFPPTQPSSTPFFRRNDGESQNRYTDRTRRPDPDYKTSYNGGRQSSNNENMYAGGSNAPKPFGFGNTSYTIRGEPASSAADSSSDEQVYNTPPDDVDVPTVHSRRLSPASRDDSPAERPHSSATKRAGSVDLVAYPPGLGITPEHSRPSTPRRQMECPVYPPGLDVPAAVSERQATTATCPANGSDELSEQQRKWLPAAQEMYDLLLNYPQGLSVGEISSILPISKIMGIESTGMNERGQVGMTAMAFKKTFSLSEPSNRGIVQILPGMPRPTGPATRNDRGEHDRRSVSRTRSDSDDSASMRPPAPAPPDQRASRFSAPVRPAEPPKVRGRSKSRGPRGRRPLEEPDRSQEAQQRPEPSRGADIERTRTWGTTAGPGLRTGWGSGAEPRNNLPGERVSSGWGASREADYRINSRSPDPRRATDRFPPYGGEGSRNGGLRNIHDEPKKFECKHPYLVDKSQVPKEEMIKLTHFVGLDEFYVRFVADEAQYERMLECLRDDYKGELECAKRQVWLKGDAVAVWLERKWQRGVVHSATTLKSEEPLEVFLIDVGKKVLISRDQILPLHADYHVPPFAVCCSIGSFDICRQKRAELVDRWEEMAEVFMSADEGSLLAEINDKVWDEKEKLKVRLCYENRSKDRPIYVPEYFVHERLIQLR
ncbi:hypothetical protein Q1695_010361 [Nippostrongylus brasiliensis]|nr:hypothetical protein Q1695_010361 [Nippostrongylus brasiliensis]